MILVPEEKYQLLKKRSAPEEESSQSVKIQKPDLQQSQLKGSASPQKPRVETSTTPKGHSVTPGEDQLKQTLPPPPGIPLESPKKRPSAKAHTRKKVTLPKNWIHF